jgi:uncharacterized protein with PQ loop repeat
MNIEMVGLLGGFTSISAALPQIYKCVVSKHTRDLSYVTNMVSYVGSCISMYYGFSIGHDAIIACSVYSIFVNTALLSTKLYFEVLCAVINKHSLLCEHNGGDVL